MKNTMIAAMVMFALAIVTVSQVDAETPDGRQGLFQRIRLASAQQEASVMEAPSVAPGVEYAAPATMAPQAVYAAPAGPCNTCCCQTCCCPVPVRMCLVDPCGCPHEVCVEVPPCCVGQQPVVSWRNGIFGRQIASVCWPCCDKQVRVVVTKHGKVRVRG